MLKDLITDLVKYIPSYLVPAIIGLFTIPVITRLFAPDVYGSYALVLTSISLLSSIAVTWFISAIIRFFPSLKEGSQQAEFYGTVIKLLFISLLVVLLIIAVIFIFMRSSLIFSQLRFLIYSGAALFVTTSLWMLMLAILRARRQAFWYSSLTIWYNAAGISLGLVLVLVFHFGIDGMIWGSVAAVVIALPLLCKIAVGHPSFAKSPVRSPLTSAILRYGLPILAVNLLTWLVTSSDRYILQYFRGSSEVGIYSVSSNISGQTVMMIASLFALVQGPIAFSLWEKKGIEASREFITKFTRYYLLIGVPVVVGLSVLAAPVVALLCAPEYYSGFKIVPLVVSAAFIIGIISSFTVGLTFHKRTDLLMYCSLAAVVFGIGINLVLIPQFGYMGAAATSLITWVIDLILVIVISRRFFVWNFPFKDLAKIALASLIMGAAVYPLGNGLTSSTLLNLVLGIAAGIAVYIIMIFLLRELQKEEIAVLRTLGQKVRGR
jgi:O-antigen/teichoic acid export membrane protein